MKPRPSPPWLNLLNAMEKEWRESEIEHGRNPDPYIEELLRQAHKWSPDQEAAGQSQKRASTPSHAALH
jgi:hypothetical protein